MRSGLRSLLAAFPDLHITVEDQIAEGDEVALRYRGEGTHRGEWRGIAPTGKRIRYTDILIQRFEGDKIAEFWAQPDLLGLLQQLGAIAKRCEWGSQRLSSFPDRLSSPASPQTT